MDADGSSILPEPPPAMPDNDNMFPLGADPQNDDGGDYCRICRGEPTDEQPLFYPCKCSGSIRYVHQDCLMEWLSHSKKKYCELCKTPFHFTKLYDNSMPATLPFPLFLRQLVVYGLTTSLRWSRYVLVTVVWFVCLPWCIRQVWRGLFWLADGSWLSESQYRSAALHHLSAGLVDLERMNASVILNGIESLNHTLLESISNTTLAFDLQNSPSITSVLNSLLRLLTGETLVSKLFRFLFSMPPIQISSSTKSSAVKSLSPRRATQRSPSLLSNMRFIKKLTTSDSVNNLSIDVAEGLLICLGLVAGFILVFLIREWVINQQPMLNIPDPDVVDNQPPAPPAADAEARPIIRPRRPRRLPRGVDQVGLPPLPIDQAMLQQAPGFPPRRAFTEDNIALPVLHEPDRPALPVRAASLISDNPFATDVAEYQSPIEELLPPPPLVRGALGNVVNVHRHIEEGMSAVTSSDNAFYGFSNPDTLATFSDQVTEAEAVPPPPSMVHPIEADNEVIEAVLIPATEVTEQNSQSSDSDDPPIPTPESEADGIRINTFEVRHSDYENADNQDAIAENDGRRDNQPEAKPLFDRLVDWLWHVDGPVARPAPEPSQDEVHIVEDLGAEAPFVPIHNGAILAPVVQPQPMPLLAMEPLPPQDHAPIQIEWNDQNAAEDAEDLEGILELIGMEGPLVGMVQNVIFSLFLITLTLTGSIWIPYVWGKLALIFVTHPMTVIVRGPAMLISTTVDVVADLGMFVLGISGLLFNHVTKLVKLITKPMFPSLSNLLDTELLQELALNATKHSGTRLEHAITGAATAVTLSSDLPMFSMESHRSLLVFKASISQMYSVVASTTNEIYASIQRFDWSCHEQCKWVFFVVSCVSDMMRLALRTVQALRRETFQNLLKPNASNPKHSVLYLPEDLLVEWSTEDKIIAIVLGYTFFAIAGFIFMKGSRLFYGLRKEERVPGALADSLRQAGGVLKVIVIIGIEMLVFPLYCGLLLDLALLPLFEGATIWTRLAFIRRAPFTGSFLHWFVGTCYMFHFALFVSMCRKILRKGVLYFIRDPDDPTFHPVRDVLERPVPTQLGKIAFSALVYGGLVIMCLGGVVWSISCVDGVLPIRWSTPEPPLAFPMDVVFYNFMLPFIIRKFEPSRKLAIVCEWWFRGCAHGLRLSHFLFGEEREEEKRADAGRLSWMKPRSSETDGSYVRAPGSDSCRIPKGHKVFLEVSEDNQRLDGKPEQDKGLYGKADDKWMKIYLPPRFRARLATFIALLWIFAAGTGVTLTIVPLLIGRLLIKWASGSRRPVNDLYALTVGLHILGFGAFILIHAKEARVWCRTIFQHYLPNPKAALPHIWSTTKYCAGLLYLLVSFGVIFPFAVSFIAELYVHIPISTFLLQPNPRSGNAPVPTANTTESSLVSSPTVFILQTWTLGLLYLRIALRIALNYPSTDSRIATAIHAIVRHGYTDPDVRQATRAIILPLTALCIVLLGAPLGYAKLLMTVMRVKNVDDQMHLYRYAYPGLMGLAVAGYGSVVLGQRMEEWRMKVRDEVYLVGERLHNYSEKKDKIDKGRRIHDDDKEE